MKKVKILFLLMIAGALVSCSTEGNKQQSVEPEEIMEVTGIVTSYNEDVMHITVVRSGINLPLRLPDTAKMNVFPAPKDTVLLIYTGNLGDVVHLPSIIEVKTRPFKETGSKVVNLKDLKKSGELIVKP